VLSQKTLQVLSDPIAREDFLRYPVIRRVQQYTSVQDALTILRSDDELMRILESESPITQEQIRAILDSQTMLDALDQTSVIEDLRPDLVAIERALEFALSDYMPLDPDADSSAPDTSPDNSDSDDDDSPSTKGPPAIAEQINFDGE